MAKKHLIKDIFRKFSIFRKIYLFVISQNMYPLNQLFQRAFDAH